RDRPAAAARLLCRLPAQQSGLGGDRHARVDDPGAPRRRLEGDRDHSLLLVLPDRERLRSWLLAGRGVAECAGLVLVGLVPALLLARLGWAFPHWLSVLLVAPIGLAALQGGAGPALLVGSFASASYLT